MQQPAPMTPSERPAGTQRRIPAGSFESATGPNYALPGLSQVSPPQPRRIPPAVLFGALLVLFLGAGGILLFTAPPSADVSEEEVTTLLRAQEEKARTQAAAPASQQAGSAVLEVETEPAGAEVTLDYAFAGQTPLRRDRLEARWYIVTVRQEGYQTLDTLVHLNDEARVRIALSLVPSGDGPGDVARLEPVPRPADPVSRPTPSSPRSSPQSTAPAEPTRLRTQPTSPRATPPAAEPTLTEPAAVEPAATEPVPPAAAQRGTLSIVVHPWGSIYIDGALRARDTDLRYETELPVGTHQVRVVHPTLGTWQRSVRVTPDQPVALTATLN